MFIINRMTKISIVIPAFNESKTIGTVLKSLNKLDLKPNTTEIILVDDGSVDETEKVVKTHSTNFLNLTYLKHKKNMGKGA